MCNSNPIVYYTLSDLCGHKVNNWWSYVHGNLTFIHETKIHFLNTRLHVEHEALYFPGGNSRKSPLCLYVTAANCIILRLQWHMQGETGKSGEAFPETGLPGDLAL